MNESLHRLGDVSTITMGTSPKGHTYNENGIGMPLLNGPTEFGPDYPHCTLYTTDPKRECEPGDLIFCVRGSTTGRMNWADKKYALGRGVCSFRGSSKSETKYIRYILENKLKALLQYAGGATFPNLSKDTLHNFKIPYPENTLRIVDLISSYDDLIENNRRRIQLLEESARLLYKEWFVRLRFPGHEHVKITDGVPSGWNSVPLEDLCFQVKNTVKPQDVEEGTNYIGLEHIPRRSITLSEWDTADKVTSNKFSYKKGDLIFGKIRPYFHKVGFTLTDGIASSDAIVIRPLKDEFYFYLLALISSDYFVSLASKTVKEGSKMPRADWNFLLKQSFILPSDSLLEVFSDYLDSIVRQLEVLALQNKNLATSRDILLPRLMNGELT